MVFCQVDLIDQMPYNDIKMIIDRVKVKHLWNHGLMKGIDYCFFNITLKIRRSQRIMMVKRSFNSFVPSVVH